MSKWHERDRSSLNAEKAIRRAIEFSRVHGPGGVGRCNTSHWMRGGTCGLLAAEAGCIEICRTNMEEQNE